MNKLLGWMMTGGLLLGYASTSKAQITIQPGRNGSPSVTFGQPAYGPQYAPSYAQPNYVQPGYAQPGYAAVSARLCAALLSAADLFVRLFALRHPGAATTPGSTTTPTPAIRGRIASNPDTTTTGITRTDSRIPPRGPGVIINGRSYTLPR